MFFINGKKIKDVRYGNDVISEIYDSQGNLLYTKFDERLYCENGEYEVALPRGIYQITVRGAGGAGGENSQTHNGGAGAKGEIDTIKVAFSEKKKIHFYVGEKGLTHANGGNGGYSNVAQSETYLSGGSAGGGGKPTYVMADGIMMIYALGGGGGGGAGRNGYYGGRYQRGSSGGAGGGYYRLDLETGEINGVDGKDGPIGAGRGGGASRGITGNTEDFPTIRSGAGQTGGANGGGASGGAGNDGGNHTHSTGGSGGAGAGGSEDAGGGQNGATNYHVEATDVIAENKEYGVDGSYGMGGNGGINGGEECQDGNDGFVFIKRLSAFKSTKDYGYVDEDVIDDVDYRFVDESIETSEDYGEV